MSTSATGEVVNENTVSTRKVQGIILAPGLARATSKIHFLLGASYGAGSTAK